MKYPGIGRLGGYAEEVAAALRRRREVRKPRVRLRVGHGEPRVLDEGSAEIDPEGIFGRPCPHVDAIAGATAAGADGASRLGSFTTNRPPRT